MVGRIHHSMDGLLQYTAHLPFIQKVDASGSKLNSLDFFFRLPSLHILNIGGCDYLDEEELNTLWKVRKEETHPHLKYIYTDCEKMNPALKEYLEKQDIEVY
ncbi:hypothetical protein AGDE_14201 [Angomonas deanei]|nr:hypothetical protein AGDE_14201 [Angomonas deanei]|eukprot:EPY21228.1 hypothetical protein AGDE_14201 [Angomonas deanei]